MFEAVFRLIIVLGILVFVHEFGHFILAKLVGIRVERFSLGFPPRMIGKQIGETDYCISWVPLGGYVKMAGMIDESMDVDSIKGEPDEFMSKPLYQRFLVIFAGPLMNIILAILIYAGIVYFSGLQEPIGYVIHHNTNEQVRAATGFEEGDRILEIDGNLLKTREDFLLLNVLRKNIPVKFERGSQILETTVPASMIDSLRFSFPPIIGSLMEDSPAAGAGIKIGDRIISIDSAKTNTWNDLSEVIHVNPGKPLYIKWEREGKFFAAEITPTIQETEGEKIGLIGISLLHTEDLNFFNSISYAARKCFRITQLTYYYVKLVIHGEKSFKEAFGGPIMIAKLAKESAAEGEINFIGFIAFISLNLGLINLLPIPVLDGGHILFLAIEGIIRRPIPTKTKLVIQQIGMVLLIAFMLFVIVNDIARLR